MHVVKALTQDRRSTYNVHSERNSALFNSVRMQLALETLFLL